jgi:stage II sporulation protein GA (sporulation sigma-E factor processing peptidase)
VVIFTIYIDIVLLENLLMNYIILYATSIITKSKISILRIIISSLIGAIYSIVIYVTNLSILSNLIPKILLSIVMVFIAYNPTKIKILGRQILFFYLTSFVFGGVSLALIHFINPQSIFNLKDISIEENTIKIIILSGVLGFFIIIIAFKLARSKVSKKDMFCNIKIKLNQKIIETTAMIDTGNLLKEPITDIPVIIVEHTLLYGIMPKEILNNLEKILCGNFDNIPEKIKNEYIARLKVIPYSSLGKQNGMLIGIKADSVEIQKTDENIIRSQIVIGIYDKSLTKKGEYRALLGIDLI